MKHHVRSFPWPDDTIVEWAGLALSLGSGVYSSPYPSRCAQQLTCQGMIDLYNQNCCDVSMLLPLDGTVYCNGNSVMTTCEELRNEFQKDADCKCSV